MRPRRVRVCIPTGLSGYALAVPRFIADIHESVYVAVIAMASAGFGARLKSHTEIRGPEKFAAQLFNSPTSTTRFDDAASSRCVAKKLMFRPLTLIVAWATERPALKNLKSTEDNG